jgi:hypothetical protein
MHLFTVKVLPNTVAAIKPHFTFIIIPVSISPDWMHDSVPAGTQIQRRSRTNTSQTYITVAQLVATLANQPFADRVVSYT